MNSNGNAEMPSLTTGLYPSTSNKADSVCSPGASEALCIVCDDAGRPQIPLSDQRCPDLWCDALNQFVMLVDGDQQRCVYQSFGVAKSACSPDGACADTANHHICPMLQQEVVLASLAPCASISGCEGGEPPSLQYAEDGTVCPGGQCLGGQCIRPRASVPDAVQPSSECAVFGGEPFCGEGVVDGLPYCEFRITTPRMRSCDDVCDAHGSFCLSAWDDERNTCIRQEPQSCSTRELDQVCRCARPPGELMGPRSN